jgi:uncharacterized protein (TIGR02266 family)
VTSGSTAETLTDEERETLVAAVAAARGVRGQLAEAREMLEAELVITPAMEAALSDLTVAVRALFALEAADLEAATGAAGDAMAALRRALASVQGEVSQHASLLVAGEGIAHALAVLYPVEQALLHARVAQVARLTMAARQAPENAPLRDRVRAAAGAGLWAARARPSPPAASAGAHGEGGSEPDADAIPLRPKPRPRRPAEYVPPVSPDPERRYSRRVALDVDIGLHSETNFFVGYGEDISEGGLFVATYDLLPRGTPLTVSLVLPGGHQITAHGRVAWTRVPGHDAEFMPGFGVTFDALSEADRREIHRFLRKRPPMFFDADQD